MHSKTIALVAAVGGLALATLGALPAGAAIGPGQTGSATTAVGPGQTGQTGSATTAATTTALRPAGPIDAPAHRGPGSWQHPGDPGGHHAPGGPQQPGLRPGVRLPDHVAAPYLDVTVRHDLPTIAAQTGLRDLTLAFLQTPAPGSCTVDWAGDPDLPVATSTYGAEITALRRSGGDVIPSFGGYSADSTGTELADSCTDVHAIAAEYERVVTTYGVQRLDFDVEVDAISNTAGIDRRNQAIHLLEQWAARTHHRVDVSYTLPSTPQGLGATGVALLQSAARYGADVRIVNAMTFDYWDGADHDMLADAETAAAGVATQLSETVAPGVPAERLLPRVGVTQMIGIDDYGPNETFAVSQAAPFVRWASAHHLGEVAFWAVERDNGTCVGTKGANACSGVAQDEWAFSRAFARFGSGWHGWH